MGNLLEELLKTREQLHQAVQLVGAVPRSYLDYDVSDASASLAWDSNHMALVSEEITLDNNSFQSGMSIRDFSLVILKDGHTLYQLSLAGKSYTEAELWLKETLSRCGFAPEKFSLKLPYEIPVYETSSGEPFAERNTEALNVFENLFDGANKIFHEFVAKNDKASDIRCWPHHFDLGALITLETDGDGNLKRSVGIGMSPGDDAITQPYYYVNSWPSKTIEDLSNKVLLGKGKWHSNGWVGSTLVFDDFKDIADPKNQTLDYLASSVHILSDTAG